MDREGLISPAAMHAAMGSPASPIIPDVRCGSLLMPTTACWCRRCGKTPWGSARPDTTFPARGAA